jgi:hypothetical protein
MRNVHRVQVRQSGGDLRIDVPHERLGQVPPLCVSRGRMLLLLRPTLLLLRRRRRWVARAIARGSRGRRAVVVVVEGARGNRGEQRVQVAWRRCDRVTECMKETHLREIILKIFDADRAIGVRGSGKQRNIESVEFQV